MASPVGILVRRRHRPEDLFQGERVGAAQRAAHEPQSAFPAGDPSDPGGGSRNTGRCGTGLAVAAGRLMKTLLLVMDLGGTFVFGLSGALAAVERRLDFFGVLVLSFAAATFGGITRDVLIGA